MRRWAVIARALSVLSLALMVPVLLSAQQSPTPAKPLPPGLGQYVMVLWESGTPVPGSPGRSMKVTEPDVAALGGKVIYQKANRRVITLPLAAANALRRHESVAYLQRMWMGESFDHWSESLSAAETTSTTSASDPLHHKTEVDTNLQWGPKDYSYDGSGNIKQIGPDQYVYDSAGRLIQAVVNGQTERYSYDAFGNLEGRAVDGGNPVSIPVDSSSNRLLGVSYDAAGNVLSGGSDGRRTYAYDSLNMVRRINGFGIPFAIPERQYIYDASDEQLGMVFVGGTTSRWTMRDFEGHVIREYRADSIETPLAEGGGLWTWEQDSFYGEGMLLGGETQAWNYTENGITTTWGGKRHYHLDHLGSVRMVTDDMGRSISEHDFFPFGTNMTRTYQEQIAWPDPHIDSMRYAGHMRDFLGSLNVEGTEYLDNMHARFYDPNLGRFLSPDPLRWIDWQNGTREERQQFWEFIANPQNFNLFAYVGNKPINRTDPRGLKGCQAGDKKFETCTMSIVYDPNTSHGTLTVTGQNKGDKEGTVLLTSSVVVGGDGHVTPTGTFTASVWEKDHVSTKYGSAANTPWSKTLMGGNAFGPYQLHIKELESRGIYIHGTMGPRWSPTTWGNSIFLSPASHGCVRMCNADIFTLHDIMPNPRGNRIIISNDPDTDN